MKIVAVGSKRERKIEAVTLAFFRMLPNELSSEEWIIVGVSADSGVGGQPLSEGDGVCGAINRAKAALKEVPEAEFAVGIEGALSLILGKYWLSRTCAAVINAEGQECIGLGPGVWVPPEISELILHQGKELGEAVEEKSSIDNARYVFGHIGLMTRNVINRLDEDAMAVIMALANFVPHDFSSKGGEP